MSFLKVPYISINDMEYRCRNGIENGAGMGNRKKRIVFIVYKAGWWGCLDGLYRKLSRDDTCECYVIPIPYYERKANDKFPDFGKRHYEAHLLPKDIPLTDYKVFQMAEQSIDELYIHNPYDDKNEIDTVDEGYYSEHLKKNTKLLVYVPHMLYLDELPESMKYLPVYHNADKILLPGESAKRAFAGIPKAKLQIADISLVEYMEGLSKIKPEVPAEWIKQLSISNSKNEQRIVLYHVSYGDLLYGAENSIKKIEYVIDYMIVRKDLLFVWRVEPAIKENLSNLPSNVISEFMRLKKRFIEECIGIFDTTDNEYLVSVLADVYMGEKHPMMNLFGIQGKPIVLLDKECHYSLLSNKDNLISFSDCAIDNKVIWYVTNEYSLICKMDLITGLIEVVTEIPEENYNVGPAYCGILKEENMLYLCPYSANNLTMYNIDTGEFTKVFIKEPCGENFDYVIAYKDYIFLKPKRYPAIVRYNKRSKDCTYFSDWLNEMEKCLILEDCYEPYFMWGVVVDQEKLMLASSKANVVLEFNMDTGEHKFYEVGQCGNRYFAMEYDGENYWLMPYKGTNIICWNARSGKWKEYRNYSDDLKGMDVPYCSISKFGKKLIALPAQANFIIIVENGSIYKKESAGVVDTYHFSKYIGDGMTLALDRDYNIIVMDSQYNLIRKYSCKISLECINEYSRNWIERERSFSKTLYTISEKFTLNLVLNYCAKSSRLFSYEEKKGYIYRIRR